MAKECKCELEIQVDGFRLNGILKFFSSNLELLRASYFGVWKFLVKYLWHIRVKWLHEGFVSKLGHAISFRIIEQS